MAVSQSNRWDKIRLGVQEAESLINQKKYNLAMVRCRQTLEYMIRDLCDKAMITTQNTNQDMSSLIDELYTNRWISKTTCEHYHKIRMLGNKAVHDGSDNAYDANQAYHLLTQEVYTFSKDFNRRGQGQQQKSQQRPQKSQQRPEQTRSRASSGQARSRKRPNQGFPFTSTDLMRLLLIVIVVILIFAVVRFFRGGKTEDEETSAAPETTFEEPLPETTPALETMAETTPPAVFKTNDYLNVRAEPSTSGRRLGVLDPDTIVDYVDAYDDEWAIINYDGTEAYVSSQYLVHD